MAHSKQMVCLGLISDPVEMRRHAVASNTDLFKADGYDVESDAERLRDPPQLNTAERNTLSSDISL